MRTIPNISHLLLPIETTIWNQFIAAITGGRTCNEKEWKLLPLPTRYGGLAFKIFTNKLRSIQQLTENNNRTIKSHHSSTNGICGGRASDQKNKIRNQKRKRVVWKNVIEHPKNQNVFYSKYREGCIWLAHHVTQCWVWF